jgi:membrane dipeptidase
LFIDSHQDYAFNILLTKRDYRRSVAETRALDANTNYLSEVGVALLGWPEYQRANLAIFFGTLFILSAEKSTPVTKNYTYHDFHEAGKLYQAEIDIYRQLVDQSPDMFRMITNQVDLQDQLSLWQNSPAAYPDKTNPVGIVLLMEGAEGIKSPGEMHEYYEQGLRLVGPVWGGGRFCGSSVKPGPFTNEGKELMHVMSELNMGLDISHMDAQSGLYALEHYDGHVIATHGNALSLVPDFKSERLFSDDVIRNIIARDSVMGVMPVNFFLKANWHSNFDRAMIPLEMLLNHIDYVCQMAGDARNVGIGTDFDGGFGLSDIPMEMDSISDIQLIAEGLKNKGYQPADVDAICYGNWQRMLERILPSNG